MQPITRRHQAISHQPGRPAHLATAKRARTIFSPSPTHLEVSDEALMLKNVDRDWLAMHLPDDGGHFVRSR